MFVCPPLCTFPDIDVAWCVLFVSLCRLAPTSEWDTAAADIIVREAGGVVLQAGKVTGKGELLEDWQVGLCCCKAVSASNSTTASTSNSKAASTSRSIGYSKCPAAIRVSELHSFSCMCPCTA